jgi:hypothetical protein
MNTNIPLTAHRPLPNTAGVQHTTAVAAVSPQETNRIAIAHHLRHQVFNNLPDPGREELVRTRSERLAAKGKTAADVIDVLAKGKQADDYSTMLVGGIRSLPFTAAGALLTALPEITTLNGKDSRVNTQNVLSAALFVATNSIAGGVLKRSTSDTQWLSAEGKQLEDAVAAHAESHKASNFKKGVASAVTVQTFTGKNIGASLMSAAGKGAASSLGNEGYAKVAGTVKGAISSGGSAAAGAMMSLLQLIWDRKNERAGPEYLMGSRDWEQQFDKLEAYNFKEKSKSVFSRAVHLPLDIAQDASKSIQSLFTPTGIVSDLMILGGGIAANELLRAKGKQLALASGASETAAALAGDLLASGGEAAYFGAWAMTASVTADVAAYANKMIDKLRTRGALEEGDLAEGQRLLENPDNRASDAGQPTMHDQIVQQAQAQASGTEAEASGSRARPRTSLTRTEMNV